MTFKIEITPSGISVRVQKTRTLYDAEGNPVEIPEGNVRSSLGIGDFAADITNVQPAELAAFQQEAGVAFTNLAGTEFAKQMIEFGAEKAQSKAIRNQFKTFQEQRERDIAEIARLKEELKNARANAVQTSGNNGRNIR